MPHLDALLQAWSHELAQALQLMTGESYPTSRPAPGAPPDRGWLWWRQEFTSPSRAVLAIGADLHVWNEVGTRVLQGAGIDLVEQSEAKNTWFEVIGQATSGAIRVLNRSGVRLEAGAAAEAAAPEEGTCFELQITAPGGVELAVALHISEALATVLQPLSIQQGTAAARGSDSIASLAQSSVKPAQSSPTMEALLDVELGVSISFGTSALPLRDVLKLTTGSVVELNRQPEEPVEVIVNDHVIARGEVVVVDGNYAVRIQEIVSRRHRLGLCESASGSGDNR